MEVVVRLSLQFPVPSVLCTYLGTCRVSLVSFQMSTDSWRKFFALILSYVNLVALPLSVNNHRKPFGATARGSPYFECCWPLDITGWLAVSCSCSHQKTKFPKLPRSRSYLTPKSAHPIHRVWKVSTANTISKSYCGSLWLAFGYTTRFTMSKIHRRGWNFESFSWNVRTPALIHLCEATHAWEM